MHLERGSVNEEEEGRERIEKRKRRRSRMRDTYLMTGVYKQCRRQYSRTPYGEKRSVF